MGCPHLFKSSKKTCVRMMEQGLDNKVSDFDVEHFCDGNPGYCYYFRLPRIQAAMNSDIPSTTSRRRKVAPEADDLHKIHKDPIIRFLIKRPTV